jgi:hypothetical protein
MSGSIEPGVVGYYADTPARDAGTLALRNAGKLGITAYVHSRQSLCVWVGGGWRWMACPQLLYSYFQGGFTDYVTVNPSTKAIVNTGGLVLVGGTRFLRIDASVDWEGTTSRGGTGLGSVNTSVVGPGISGGNMFTEITKVDQPGQRNTSRSWMVQVSGTVTYSLTLVGGNVLSGSINANNVQLQITDFGPVA